MKNKQFEHIINITLKIIHDENYRQIYLNNLPPKKDVDIEKLFEYIKKKFTDKSFRGNYIIKILETIYTKNCITCEKMLHECFIIRSQCDSIFSIQCQECVSLRRSPQREMLVINKILASKRKAKF